MPVENDRRAQAGDCGEEEKCAEGHRTRGNQSGQEEERIDEMVTAAAMGSTPDNIPRPAIAPSVQTVAPVRASPFGTAPPGPVWPANAPASLTKTRTFPRAIAVRARGAGSHPSDGPRHLQTRLAVP